MRMNRIVNFTCTSKDDWYQVYDERDYKDNRTTEIKVKLREDTTADHFRYAYSDDPAAYMTVSTGFVTIRNAKEIWVYVPDVAAQVIEIEIIYK